jgi:hypothetical protein
MMIRIGTTKAVWIVFVLALIIIGLAAGAALGGGTAMQARFIFTGLAVAIVPGAVVHHNWTGRDNIIVTRVGILHSSLSRIIP